VPWLRTLVISTLKEEGEISCQDFYQTCKISIA
jgi:hypothetical protein